jgi:phenylalanine-4-hydroxylase
VITSKAPVRSISSEDPAPEQTEIKFQNTTTSWVHAASICSKLVPAMFAAGRRAMPHADSLAAPGLTTNEAPFIESVRNNHQIYIDQPYELYSKENHEAWRRLYARMLPRWRRYANQHFLRGVDSLRLDPDRVPRLSDVNRFLSPLTGFRARAVSGYVPAFLFFDCLRRREFPTTITIRRSDRLDYLPEPDIFHDIAGHVPMHTDPAFAETLVKFGECAHTAADLVTSIRDPGTRTHALTSIIKAMARFFWFTIEFGLMRGPNGGLKAYGSGLLSSYGEIAHAIEAPEVQRYPIQLEWIVNQGFEIDHYQPLLFIVDSFDHLFSLVDRLEQWVKLGKLSNVAPGEPAVNERDLQSFLARG